MNSAGVNIPVVMLRQKWGDEASSSLTSTDFAASVTQGDLFRFGTLEFGTRLTGDHSMHRPVLWRAEKSRVRYFPSFAQCALDVITQLIIHAMRFLFLFPSRPPFQKQLPHWSIVVLSEPLLRMWNSSFSVFHIMLDYAAVNQPHELFLWSSVWWERQYIEIIFMLLVCQRASSVNVSVDARKEIVEG